MAVVNALVLALVAGSLAYCALVVIAVRRWLAIPPSKPGPAAFPISVLKPLHGLDEGLEANLRSFFTQDYPAFELLFAVRHPGDPAVAVVEALRRQYPHVPARLIITGEPPYPNAKVFSLDRMLAEARHDLIVMSDSDIRVGPDLLSAIAAEFQDERLGLLTCPYRAVPGRSFWSTLEALGMNTDFWAGVLVARMLEGMKFGVGPTMVARRQAIERIGGLGRLKQNLAEDFALGRLISEAGYRTDLSSYVVEHRIGAQPFRANLAHRVRWARSTRRSRPAGYFGQLFTYPLPLALLFVAAAPHWWPLLGIVAAARATAAWAVARHVLRDSVTHKYWWLVPLQDAAAFFIWVTGFFGRTIVWRGRRYRLYGDGRFKVEQLG